MSLMYSDDGDTQNPAQAPSSLPAVSRQELAPDQAVPIRAQQPVLPATVQPVAARPPEPITAPVEPSAAVLTAVPAAADATPQFAEPPSRGFYADDDTSSQPSFSETSVMSWTATEFIAHPKTTNWYLAFIVTSLVVTLLAFLISHDVVTVIVLIICAGLFGYTASRQPRQLQYGLDSHGISIGQKHYPYKDFKSFAVLAEGGLASIDFMPLKRFAPMLNIYVDPAREPEVVDILSDHLPSSYHKRTFIDELMHRIHF